MPISYQRIVDFSIELDKILINEKHMFCTELLKLLDHLFDIHFSGIIVHKNTQYLQTFSHNLNKNADDLYDRYYHRYDIINLYIEKNWDKLFNNFELIQSTKIIPAETYDDSEYVHFLNEAGTHYILVMIFNDFYLTLHRNKDNGDFLEDELVILKDIYRLLRYKYDLYQQQQQIAYLPNNVDKCLNAHKTGTLFFDDALLLVHHNEFAEQYTTTLLGTFDPSTIYKELVRFLKLSDTDVQLGFEHRVNEFMIVSQYFNEEDYYHKVSRFLSISLSKQHGQEFLPSQVHQINTLTVREMDVTKAIAKGMHYQDVADELSISINTVRTHLKHIHRKLNIKNQRTLVRLFSEYQAYGEPNI